MDNYLDKQRVNSYYLILAQREANNLRAYARQVSSLHLKNLIPHLNFNNEIDKFITVQLQNIKTAKAEYKCKEYLFNLKEEKHLIYQQDVALKTGTAKVVASAELVNKLDTWGYVINGVGVVLGGFQIAAGSGIVLASLTHGNIIGIAAGTLLVLHGLNGMFESLTNITTGRNDTVGAVKKGYIHAAEFMGFSDKAGAIAYSGIDIGLSGYGLVRQVMKPEAWRLFQYLPSDFVRSYKTMSVNALIIEGVSDGFTLKSVMDGYNTHNTN